MSERMHTLMAVLSAVTMSLALPAAFAQPCEPTWSGSVGVPGLNDTVWNTVVFDDGTGLALYGGGDFTLSGDVVANRIAKWDGYAWSALGTGMNDTVYAVGYFDAGTGPVLYAGGWFTEAGGVAADYIAEWDGNTWSPVGGGTNNHVQRFLAFDDGTGSALYVSGRFTQAGGLPASGIARWDGATWSPLGEGLSGVDNSVEALAIYDDGTGPALYAGGYFTRAGVLEVNGIARWDGSTWSALGSGVDGGVWTLMVFDDGNGPALYAGGDFQEAGGVAADYIARWDGNAWSAVGGGVSSAVAEFAVFDDGAGPGLFAGGWFHWAYDCDGCPPKLVNHIAKWDGNAWSALGSGADDGVYALSVFDDGIGPAVYAAGWFDAAGDRPAHHIARWGFVLGDLDCDADVDHSDLGILLSDWGCTGDDCPGDADGDGDTDHADLAILLAHFGFGS
ncbi:MAG TPA: hypothetical protein VM487_17745 [Phycisphaerae bacterium]|nr:hypothetical protein [Phycisphaerae bacterium]